MGRILAIDIGTKRTGIAVTDPLKLIAGGLDTIASGSVITYLEDYLKREEVECVVVGNPTTIASGVNNRGGDMNKLADDFCSKIKERFPSLDIQRIDEFYSSKLAERTILQSGINKSSRQNKSLVDKISATIILQSYLDKR